MCEYLRFLDLGLEGLELGGGEAAIFVLVELLDVVQSALLGVTQLRLEHLHGLVERDVRFSSASKETNAPFSIL